MSGTLHAAQVCPALPAADNKTPQFLLGGEVEVEAVLEPGKENICICIYYTCQLSSAKTTTYACFQSGEKYNHNNRSSEQHILY